MLHTQAKQFQHTEDEISLRSLTELDLSQLSISGISYNLDLNSAGHQYDGAIATASKVAAAAVAVVAVAGSGGSAMAGLALDNVIDVADTVSDVASIASNKKSVRRIENVVNFVGKANEQYSNINNYNEQIGQNIGSNKGIVESMVGFVTDKTMGKPQRKRAIRNYMNETLLPEFKQEMERITLQLTQMISGALHQEAAEHLKQKEETLCQLKKERSDKKEAFNQRMAQLKDYKHELLTL